MPPVKRILEIPCYWCSYNKFRWNPKHDDEAQCIACQSWICRTTEDKNWRPLSQKYKKVKFN